MAQTDPVILFESEDAIVINKPAGWLTIPGRDPKDLSPVLWTSAEKHFLSSGPSGGAKQLWVVHRLDRGTTGCLVFAKSATAHKSLCHLFETRKAKKSYLALVEGIWTDPVRLIKTPIEGKKAVSQVKRLKTMKHTSLCEIELHTGRTHQIRIHLSSLGFPIVGDTTYGSGVRSTRPLLHAHTLMAPGFFESVMAPMPQDFSDWISGDLL